MGLNMFPLLEFQLSSVFLKVFSFKMRLNMFSDSKTIKIAIDKLRLIRKPENYRMNYETFKHSIIELNLT